MENQEMAQVPKPEKDFESLPAHEKRVVEEREELTHKAIALDKFIQGEIYNTLSSRQKYLLKKQLMIMDMYIEVLDCRISSFYDEEDSFTRGEELIGFFGNENFNVFTFKCLAAEFINQVDRKGGNSPASGRNKAIATTDIESAQMRAVKSLF